MSIADFPTIEVATEENDERKQETIQLREQVSDMQMELQQLMTERIVNTALSVRYFHYR